MRLCRDLEIAPGKNAFGNIEQLEGSGIISKWINSYLHSLRILGNESVHLAERHQRIQRIPKALAAGDLVVILSNMVRVLDSLSSLAEPERPRIRCQMRIAGARLPQPPGRAECAGRGTRVARSQATHWFQRGAGG